MKSPFLFGISQDLHRLENGDGIVLAGVQIPCGYAIVAHSDGDVVLHCLSEAIFLSLGEKDLGDQFKTHSSKTLGMDSGLILKKALDEMKGQGYGLMNVTVKVFLERPKLYNYKDAMRKKLSSFLDLEERSVGLALGTYEGLDSLGKGKAIMALASVSLGLTRLIEKGENYDF